MPTTTVSKQRSPRPEEHTPEPQPVAREEQGGQRFGRVAIVGRPNVGKSTLLNQLIGVPISITSRKPQTTRHQIHGIVTHGHSQIELVDTPGWQRRQDNAMHRVMRNQVHAALSDVDLTLMVVEAGTWLPEDDEVVRLLPVPDKTVLLANKADRLRDRAELLPWVQDVMQRFAFCDVFPLCATRPREAEKLLNWLAPRLPEAPWVYEADDCTIHSKRFLAAEHLREQLFRFTGDEIPYTTTVEIEKFEETPQLCRIFANIVLNKENHKPMVLGAGGERLKRIGTLTRQKLERIFDCKVYLEIWVKVRSGWADNEASLQAYGYR